MPLDPPRSARTQAARDVTAFLWIAGAVLTLVAFVWGDPGWFEWGVRAPIALLAVVALIGWVVRRFGDYSSSQ